MQQDPVLKMDILIWRIFKLLTKNKKQILDSLGLTCSQFEILSAIYYYSVFRTEIIQVDLSEKTEIDPMTTSIILRNLERKELITRCRSTVNTRTVLVKLTEKGSELLKKATMQIRLSCTKLYESIDKDKLTSQLLKLSEKLNSQSSKSLKV